VPDGRDRHLEDAPMIETQLCAGLERRAGAFIAAAQFAADARQLRAAAIVGASVIVARRHGTAGVEGYLAALIDLETSEDDGLARRAIRAAIDEAFVDIAAAAWAGGLSALVPPEPIERHRRDDRTAA
jgi:hypothetical protein